MITLDSVTLSYGARTVLSEVSMSVMPGELLALIGPNGVGKSTLIRATSGVLAPARGTIAHDGREIHRLKPEERARRIAVVPQASRLPEAFTVLDTVLMGRTAYLGWLGHETDRDRDAALEAMRRTGIEASGERRIGELSSGEQQLVLIARALAQAAPALLMDEPTAHLDLKHQAGIMELTCDLARRDKLAVAAALHDLNLAAQFADRVALLSGGRLHALGPPREVLTAERLSEVYGVSVRILPHPTLGTPIIITEKRKP
jgi:iron complex transport system ATP-binding protein